MIKDNCKDLIAPLFGRVKALVLVPAIFAVAAVPLQGAVVYDLGSTVLDGSAGENTFFVSNSQASPSGLAYNSGTPSLTWTEGASSSFTYLVGYFNSSTLINTGDSISLSFAIAPSSVSAFSSADLSLRLGLFNSGGSKLTANVASAGAASLSAYTGYMGAYRPNGTTSAADSFYQRTGTNTNLMATGAYSLVSGSPTLVSPGTGNITGTLTFTLVPTGLEIRSVINGGAAQSVIDTSGLVSTFDSFSFFATSGNTNATFTFTDLSVSTVPEPSTYALLAGGLCILACLRKRRSRMN